MAFVFLVGTTFAGSKYHAKDGNPIRQTKLARLRTKRKKKGTRIMNELGDGMLLGLVLMLVFAPWIRKEWAKKEPIDLADWRE